MPSCLGARWTGASNKHGRAVVGELANRLENVCQGAVPAILRRCIKEHSWVPATRQLLDARNIHIAVVQPPVDLGHVLVQEHPVGADRIAGEGGFALGWYKTLDVSECLV